MNKKFMQKALEIASLSGNDMPIGAVIVKNNGIIAYAHNQKEKNNDVSAHAEILAIKEASKKLGNWRLKDCDLYVTLEPCPMCLWAIIQSRMSNVYFGSYDMFLGGFSNFPQMLEITGSKLKHKGGIMEEECNAILNNYLKKIRDVSDVDNQR